MPDEDRMDIDDLEGLEPAKSEEKPKVTPLADLKLEGDEVPEELRGKSAADLIRVYGALSEGFKKAEKERLEAIQRPLTIQAPPAQPLEVKPEPELSDEQLGEQFKDDPVGLAKAVTRRETRTMDKLAQERMAPLLATLDSGVATQELLARQRHSEDFQLYGDEILKATQGVHKNALLHPGAWDDIVRYVKGGHIDEIIERKAKKAVDEAKVRQAADVGAHARPASGAPIRDGASGSKLDTLQQEVMSKMGIFDNEDDFLKWSGKGPMTMKEL